MKPFFFNSANTAHVPTVQKKIPEQSRLIFMNQPGRSCFGNSTWFNHKVCQQLKPNAKL